MLIADHLERLGYRKRAERIGNCERNRRCRDCLCSKCMLVRSGILAQKLNLLPGKKYMATLTWRKAVFCRNDFTVRRNLVSNEFSRIYRTSWAFLAWEYTERIEGGIHAHVHAVVPDARELREIMALTDGGLDIRPAYNTNELVKYMTAMPVGLRWLAILGKFRRYATYGKLRKVKLDMDTIFHDL